jgi:hypothetical protein
MSRVAAARCDPKLSDLRSRQLPEMPVLTYGLFLAGCGYTATIGLAWAVFFWSGYAVVKRLTSH